MEDFTVFESLPQAMTLVNNDPPNFSILGVTSGFLTATGCVKSHFIWKPFFDAFGSKGSLHLVDENQGTFFQQPGETNAANGLGAQQIPAHGGDSAPFTHFTCEQVCDPDKPPRYFIVTWLPRMLNGAGNMGKLPRYSLERAADFFRQAPVAIAIVRGPEYVFELANEGMLTFLGRTADVIGKPLLEVLPESKLQGLVDIFDHVRVTGNNYQVHSYPAVILINGEREQRFFDVKFQRYEQGDDDEDVRIFCVAHNVTEQVLAKKQLEANEAELQRRVHERTQELDTINKELKQSNLSLEEFAYAASHDLKAPIRKINMLAQRLNRELAAELNESQQRVFNKMEESASRMLTLIDDLLSFSHINKGAGVFDEIDLSNKLKKVLDDLEMEILEKGAQISFDKLPVVLGNRRQLQQLFQNLISNALKYTKPGVVPRIHISSKAVTVAELETIPRQLDATKAYHLVEVKDNGIGFAQEDADQIFNVFTRLHSQAEYSGSGVGLSIVKRVVENHQGQVWAESRVGEGATFKILLPQHVQ